MIVDFALDQTTNNSLDLGIRCQVWSVCCDDIDELSDEDVAMWERIVAILNENAERILGTTG